MKKSCTLACIWATRIRCQLILPPSHKMGLNVHVNCDPPASRHLALPAGPNFGGGNRVCIPGDGVAFTLNPNYLTSSLANHGVKAISSIDKMTFNILKDASDVVKDANSHKRYSFIQQSSIFNIVLNGIQYLNSHNTVPYRLFRKLMPFGGHNGILAPVEEEGGPPVIFTPDSMPCYPCMKVAGKLFNWGMRAYKIESKKGSMEPCLAETDPEIDGEVVDEPFDKNSTFTDTLTNYSSLLETSKIPPK